MKFWTFPSSISIVDVYLFAKYIEKRCSRCSVMIPKKYFVNQTYWKIHHSMQSLTFSDADLLQGTYVLYTEFLNLNWLSKMPITFEKLNIYKRTIQLLKNKIINFYSHRKLSEISALLTQECCKRNSVFIIIIWAAF